MGDTKFCQFLGWNRQLKCWCIRSYSSKGAAFVASHEKGSLKWWLPGMACILFNEHASFVQALRLDFCSIGSGSLIWFTRSLLPYTSLWVTRNGTRKCLRKNWSQITYSMSDWNEKLKIHIWDKKVPLQLCPFLSFLVCTEKKPNHLVIPLCKRETVHEAVLITVLVWTRNSLRCHPKVLCRPSFFCGLCAFCDYGYEEKLWGWAPCYGHAREGHVLWGRNLSSSPCVWSWFVCFILQRNCFLPLHF